MAGTAHRRRAKSEERIINNGRWWLWSQGGNSAVSLIREVLILQIHSENIFPNSPDEDRGKGSFQHGRERLFAAHRVDAWLMLEWLHGGHVFSAQGGPEEDGCQGAPEEDE